jgi:hypothetical protein
VAVTEKLRGESRLSECFITEIKHELRQKRNPTKFCQAFFGPTLGESVVAVSGFITPQISRFTFGEFESLAAASRRRWRIF